MTARVPCPPAPGPLEAYAASFDDLFRSLAQRRGFREYLTGLLPRDRNKTLTALAGAEPVVGAQHPAVQRLQFFLSESTWKFEQVNARRLELLAADTATAPHGQGVLVIDDSGDRKDGMATAHIGRQWLGRLGKTDNGIVTVTTLWADERLYYPLHATPYTPAHHFPKKRTDPEFRTKPQLAAQLAGQARQAGFPFRAVVADCGYGDHDEFRHTLREAGLPFVMALKPRRGTWAYGPDAHTPVDAAHALSWTDPDQPGDWTPVMRTFRDGHTETWWAADARLGGWGPDSLARLVVATADPATLPHKATWYLATNLPRPASPRLADSPHEPAGLAELVRLYGLRHWIEQSYKQIKDELGWADFQVRSDTAIRRHQTLVNCAFSFCWDAWFTDEPQERDQPQPPETTTGPERGHTRVPPAPAAQLAPSHPQDPSLARPLAHPATLLAGLVDIAPATRTPEPHHLTGQRPTP
ncbi:IS701 family transposase [Streptomyces sp. NBC_01443]|uniref:IS701 family transposase n=1 Tax=Streptomyces sp. NBC_01443 TaxID=2903868 RepID=UPI00225AEA0B|nr:IS701 family transposase [Streptomyces sp. NBC_01443]MCX4632727.1 IS701 family transposase [Streptomyces sp. NBC_01443]